MMPSPARADIHLWSVPTTVFTIGTATMPRPRKVSKRTFFSGIARSMSSRIRSGGMRVSSEMTRIVTTTTTRSRR